MDSVVTSNDTSNVEVATKRDTGSMKAKDKKQKPKKGKSAKSKDKATKAPVKHRDHLSEPVQE